MNLDLNKKYIFDTCYDVLHENDDYLYIDYEKVKWLRTNSTGGEIVSLCKGEMTLEQIIKDLSYKYDFPFSVLKSNFEGFITEIIEKGILVDEIVEKEVEEYRYPDSPNDIWLHVTEKCNLSCPFCYSESGSLAKNELDLKSVLSFLEQIPEEKRGNIFISGGEPFLYKDLPEFVKSIYEMKFYNIILISNGTVGEEVYEKVLPYISTLQISVDGTTKDIHEITRGKGNFEKVVNKFKLARELGVKNLVLSFTPTKYNIDDLPNLPKFAFDHGINHLHITRLIPAGRCMENMEDLAPDDEILIKNVDVLINNVKTVNTSIYYIRETDEMFLEEYKKRNYIGISIAADQSDKVIMGAKRRTCGLGTILSVNYDGNIYICPSLSDDEFILGNINHDKFEDIVVKNLEFAKKLSVDNLSEECRACKLKYFCGGGCRACAMVTGNVRGMDGDCKYYKESIMKSMWYFRNVPVIEE